MCFLHDIPRLIDQVILHQRFADLIALCLEESKGHTATDDHFIHFVKQVGQRLKFSRYFRPAYDRYKGSDRVFKYLSEKIHFFGHQETGSLVVPVELLCNSIDGSVLSVTCTKSIIDIDIGKGSQLFGKCLIIAGLPCFITKVLKHQNVTCLQFGCFLFGIRTDNIIGHEYLIFYLQKRMQPFGYRFQRVFLFIFSRFGSLVV